jgi:hypothetical protein
VETDYAAAIGNRMSLTESDGPCKNELRYQRCKETDGKGLYEAFMIFIVSVP